MSINNDNILRKAKSLPLIGLLIAAFAFSSCKDSFLYDDEGDCDTGLVLRFVFDYHMEPGANSFPANVDCVSVFVLDPDGNYLTQFSETSKELQDENYRMQLPLEAGDYHLLVYGGLTCENPAFTFAPEWLTKAGAGTKDDVKVTLPLDEEGVSNKKLHDIEEHTGGLFYGTLDVTISEEDWVGNKREETVYMMKDTNNIQVILQELAAPYQIDHNDYNFRIIDDNSILDGYNNPVHIATETFQPSYTPYAFENRIMGYVEPVGNNGAQIQEDRTKPVQVACAEFSTSRLHVDHLATARLVVSAKPHASDTGAEKEIINIPLITYLAATRGFGQNWIKSDQEYLDRQSNWTLMFFLQRNAWVKARVAVNSWIVRINDIELGF